MRYSAFIFLVAPVIALPSVLEARSAPIRPWKPAGETDSRGPCPMLNTLANHGYINHSGRNITVENIADGIFAATNWSRDFGLIPGRGAFAVLGGKSAIDLEELNNRTAGIERPASLARADDSNTVIPARVQTVMDDSADPKYITVESFGRTRARLEAVSPLTPAQQNPARGEAAFVLMLTADGEVPESNSGFNYTTLKAFKDRAYMFLSQERLPVSLGWKPSQRLVQFADISPISAAIAAAQQAIVEEEI
ncbi:Chloroperoxidase [Stachybotrys elegans]|uniref:Chloroperoxidase n=1 Tax=Stachybotrys elegans TaxID=80388 RepID=A0A8K0SG31_9HYPO|nr:Chloroperoxidase [Stachybotrys elegans]